MTAVLWWLKRDLRVSDNAALERACRLGAPVPVYVVEPDLWGQPDASGRQYAFLCETLEGLRDDLRGLGADLVVRVGDAVPVLEALRRECGAQAMVSTQETGNRWTYARDRQVADWARGVGVRWDEVQMGGVVRGRHDRDGWARRRGAVMAQGAVPAPDALPAVTLDPRGLPSAAELGLRDVCPERQRGGRARALSDLGGFLTARGRDYRREMSSPLTGAQACSRMSPHLAFGSLSEREVVQACAARQREVSERAWRDSLKSFQSRLAWRGHFIQKLEDEPALEWRALHRMYEGLRPVPGDAARLQAWASGETGLPFVDACMRSLRATGWLNFRMRAMVMSVASYHLWLPWQESGAVLARLFTDYEPGIHWSQCQMQSGTTGINTLRMYNPLKQGRDQDPEGVFTRRWCPELRGVPDAVLQEPWKAGGARGYPDPIVDVAKAGAAAREAVWAVRRAAGFGAEAGRVVKKHASRKDPQRHFVNDREGGRSAARGAGGSKGDDRQMRFDFE